MRMLVAGLLALSGVIQPSPPKPRAYVPRSPFQYAVLRVVPQVERGECVNAGVVVFAQDGLRLVP